MYDLLLPSAPSVHSPYAMLICLCLILSAYTVHSPSLALCPRPTCLSHSTLLDYPSHVLGPVVVIVCSVRSLFLLWVFPMLKPASPDPEGKNTGWNKRTNHGNLIAVGPFQSREAPSFMEEPMQAGFWAGGYSPLGLGAIMFKELEKFSPGTVSGLSSLE